MDKPDGSNATLRVNLTAEHSQRIKPHGNKPRLWSNLTGAATPDGKTITSREQPDGVYSHASREQPRLLASFHGVWENLLD